jgi:hypothetical protein
MAQLVERPDENRESHRFGSVHLHIGELAQLVERFHGMEEAIGSNPLFSTLERLFQFIGMASFALWLSW